MLAALAPLAQSAARRRVTYAGCISSIVVAAVLFSLYGRLQVPRNLLPKGGMPAVSQIRPRLNSNYAKLPLSFEANQGQAGAQVKFLSRGRDLTLFLTGNEAVLEVQKSGVRIQDSGTETKGQESGVRSRETGEKLRRSRGPGSLQPTTDHRQRANPLIQSPKSKIENRVVRLRLVGAKTDAEVIGLDELPGKVNYFIGNDPKKWRTHVPTYGKVRYHNVYPGVDLDYYGNQGGQLEYDFIVAPGADPNAIALDVGAGLVPARGRPQGSPLRIDRDGDLVISAKGGEIRFHKPRVYQVGTGASLVEAGFHLDARNRIRFALGPYDHTKPLVIDPVLSYSTYLGGSGGDWGHGIAVDSSGNAYVTGQTASVDFPTAQPVQSSLNGTFFNGMLIGLAENAFVSKLNATGSALVYSTYLGGNGIDGGNGIAVDSLGNVYVGGTTSSTNFPTVNPLQAENNASYPLATGFVAKLNPSGSALVYSTYLGGSGGDDCQGIAVDASGDAVVVGVTHSTDFPTASPFQASNKSPTNGNGFVSKLNPSGSALIFSTYLGGSGGDGVQGIAVDSGGNAYLTGYTQSTDFPTLNPLQATLNGPSDAFVAELNSAGSALVYSTFVGGSSYDQAAGVAVDTSGNVYVTGYTQSTDFPTVNPVQATNKGAAPSTINAFVAKLNPGGNALAYSTYLGGSGQDSAMGIGVDASGDAFVVGSTSSKDFPIVNALQATNNAAGSGNIAGGTAFVAELNAAGSALVYSTYLGGSIQETANGVGVGSSGNAYITGDTLSPDFPTVNPLQPANKYIYPPGPTAFVAELSAGPAPALSFSPSVLNVWGVPVNTTSAQQTVTVTNLGNAPLTITGITASGDFAVVTTASTCLYVVQTVAAEANCTIAITFTPTAASTRTGAVTVTDDASGSPQTLQLIGNGPVSGAVVSPGDLILTYNYSVGPSAPTPVTLTNTAPAALSVTSVTVPNGYTQSNNCLPSVAPNASCTINVSFQPTVGGLYQGYLTVTDDAVNSPQTAQLMGTAFVGPSSLSPTSLTFGDQAVGVMSPAQTMTLLNAGDDGVPIFTITGDFSTDAQSCVGELILSTGSNCAFNVWFTPTSVGTRTGTLTVTYTGTKPLTLTASLTGMGEWPGVGLSATSLNFAAQTVSTKSAPQMITLTNTGNAALSPLTITRSGPFAETNNCGGFVAVGASCAVGVTFSPIDAGSGSGTLTLTDNAGTQTVPLSGSGMDFAVTSSTTTQTVSAGQTAKYSLTFAPQGGFNQTVNLTCTRAPSESTCTLTPSTVALNGTASTTVAVAVSTTAPSLAPPQGRFLPPGMKGLGRVFWLCALLWLASVAALATARKRRAACLLCASLLLVVLWSACGGGTTARPPSSPGTLAGTYSVDVTATDAAVSTLTHTIQLTLTVN
jgi:hypothetical protein